jgi:SAM-dependent methyltransferase
MLELLSEGPEALGRKISGARVRSILRRVARGLIRRAREGLGALRPAEIRAARKVAETDRLFDLRHGVQTGGRVVPRRFGVSAAQRRSAVTYRAVDPEEFSRGFQRLGIEHERFTFVDLGSGKGRALFLASDYPFRRLVGVEFSPRLHRVAQANVRQYRSDRQRCQTFDLHCMDAGEFTFPDGPLVVFLYNPFDATVMARVAARLRASFLEQPREILVLYANPFQAQVWEDAGFRCVDRGDLFMISRPVPPAPETRPPERPAPV